jgi:hypothetical protein
MGLVEFFGSLKMEVGTPRNLNQLVAHCFLLSGAATNVVYLVLIAGLGTRSLQKNFLQQLALVGALMQIGSCGCSLWRYNIEEEYNNTIGHAGSAFGLLGGMANNLALSTIWIHGASNRKSKMRMISAFIVLLFTVPMVMEIIKWDELSAGIEVDPEATNPYIYFRVIEGIKMPYTITVCLFTARALKNGKATIDPKIIATEDLVRVLYVMAGFLAFCYCFLTLGLIGSQYTTLIYYASGLQFGVYNIMTYYMGQMNDFYDVPIGGEGDPLQEGNTSPYYTN